jgi:hypothetical protein
LKKANRSSTIFMIEFETTGAACIESAPPVSASRQ